MALGSPSFITAIRSIRLGYHLYRVLEEDTLVGGMPHLLDGQNDMAGNRPMSPGSKLQ